MDRSDEMYKEKLADLLRAIYAIMGNKDDNVPCKIEEGLFLGSLQAAKNKNLLKDSNITQNLIVAASFPPSCPDEFTYKIIPVADREETNLAEYFDECFNFIEEAKRMGSGVLVHCFAGISRSVTIVVAYLMKKHGMTLPQAFELVKGKRRQASPNSGFMRQLDSFEKSLQAADKSSKCSS